MRYPLGFSLSMAWYLARQKLRGARRFPLVLMLEPTHRCNLACRGCGRIREYKDTLDRQMSIFECLQAVYECGAPIVSICGGEPLLYKGIGDLVGEILAARRCVYLCTNGLLLQESLPRLKPHRDFIINVHVDGLASTHERLCDRAGIFDNVIQGIRQAKQSGFRVCTNTTIYKGTDLEEVARLFALLRSIGVDGFLLSPGFAFDSAVPEVFLNRGELRAQFSQARRRLSQYNLWNTPLYLSFLAGETPLRCAPWANPTCTPLGWRSPCYLLCERHYPSFSELMAATDWERFGNDAHPKCRDCTVHSGFEPAAVLAAMSSFRHFTKMLRWKG